MVSEETMEAVLETSLIRTTALQAYIADELFGDVRSDVATLQTFATELFEHAESFSPHPFYPPDKANDGVASVMLIHEPGVDPEQSEQLALIAHMSEIMLAMFRTSDTLSGIFVGTADGNLLFVNDRSGAYVAEDGTVMTLDVTSRPWYVQAAEAGELVFTDLESDAYTGISTLECAAPVYYKGELVAVVGADTFLTSISDYVNTASTQGGFLSVINQDGQVLFSPNQEGTFKAELSADAPDLRKSGNTDLARFVTQALTERIGLETLTVDGKEYYVTGVPMPSVGWAVISAVEKELTRQPTVLMLERYEEINSGALSTYTDGVEKSKQTFIILTVALVLLALVGALVLAQRIVKPIEHMTKRIQSLRDGDTVFKMEKAYRTNDEIEILAESFAELSGRTRDYIAKITEITAEKERIGTELALATRIQADMLPNIYPAFPERSEFDIYASMNPAKEVGGDFYDFFLVDDDHLCMVMADVSGKGVPAALFMMVAKIMLANNAMAGKSPAQVLMDTNNAICANNREEMFVTVWLGILELSTGKLTAANAGHEYPVFLQPDGKFELLKDKHGFVIGGMEGALQGV